MARKKRKAPLLSLNKQRFLQSRECLTRGWYLRHDSAPDIASLSDAEIFLIEQGQRVGALARQRYPEGVLVESDTTKAAESRTRELLADKATRQVFEATFRYQDLVARADIIERVAGGWHVIEVKSSRHPVKKSKLDMLRDDLAFTVMVAQKAGLRVKRASLALISGDYRLGMEAGSLLIEQDHTEQVRERVRAYGTELGPIAEATAHSTPPTPALSNACNGCAYFASECLGKGVDHPVTELPRIGKKISTLNAIAIADIPRDTKLTPRQKLVAQSVWAARPQHRPRLQTALSEVNWPAYYLDFETTATALPLYADIAPYEAVPTQYSIHCCNAPGQVDWHKDFLADPDIDCRHALAEQLIRDLKQHGDIIVYTGYEKRVITSLMALFPELEAPLRALLARLFDLEKALNGAYYHPDFRGSYSIKRVLPVLVEGAGYADQSIHSGNEASAAFARLALGEYSERESARVKTALREYCKQDTQAMVDLHEALLRLDQPPAS